MTNEIIDIREELTGEDARKELLVLESLVKTAILNPDTESRQHAIESLYRGFDGNIVGGFMGDNQLFLKNRFGRIYYICDKPQVYIHCPPEIHNFEIPQESSFTDLE